MHLEVKLKSSRGPLYKFEGKALIDGKVAASAEFAAMVVEPGR